MKLLADRCPEPDQRQAALNCARNSKMAHSAYAYVRDNPVMFYAWLDALDTGALPAGPAIWICGDCHLDSLGPVAGSRGPVCIQIRDFDQPVVGNPVHDLMRLGLSFASAIGASGGALLPLLEQLVKGYQEAFDAEEDTPPSTQFALKSAAKHLAPGLAANAKPTIPLGERFWPILNEERYVIGRLMAAEQIRKLATSSRSRDDSASVRLLDAAFWMKGCNSLSFFRYCVLLGIGAFFGETDICLMDVKEAGQAAAPSCSSAEMPTDNGQRVVEGARHLSPILGDRMRADRLLGRSVFIREFLPHDLEIGAMTGAESMKAARFLAAVVGKAHARQMDRADQARWRARKWRRANPK